MALMKKPENDSKKNEVKIVPDCETQDYPQHEEESNDSLNPEKEGKIVLSKEEVKLLKTARHKNKSKAKILRVISENPNPRFNVLLDEDQKEDLSLLKILFDNSSKSDFFVSYLDEMRMKHADVLEILRAEFIVDGE